MAFDGINLVAHRAEHCTLVAAARANLQDLGPGFKLEQFRLTGYRMRLADGLPRANLERRVLVRELFECRRQEKMTRYPIHGRENGFILDAHFTKFLQHLTA